MLCLSCSTTNLLLFESHKWFTCIILSAESTSSFVSPSPFRFSFLLRFLSRTKCSPPLNLHIHIDYSLIYIQPHRSTRSSDVVTLSRPPSSSSLKVSNRSFRHASPCLWNQLPKELRLPSDHEDLSLSSDLTHVSSLFPSSPLSPSFSLPLQARELIFSTNPFLHSSSTFPPTALTP